MRKMKMMLMIRVMLVCVCKTVLLKHLDDDMLMRRMMITVVAAIFIDYNMTYDTCMIYDSI